MVREAKGAEGAKSNCTLPELFRVCLDTPELLLSFKAGSLDGKDSLHCIHAGTVALTSARVAVLKEKGDCTTSEEFLTVFAVNEKCVLQKLVTEWVQQILRASLFVFPTLKETHPF